ncbi:hypothetical protein [Bacillus sp. MUM 13]|uniref:hypothetical protein n=1 Tax=Bacillus sp. MUM 13 TaxID=1678001 RepID=UPI0008F55A81|nr:hypothetical protein [Bacillus sp. MUM 13]OIK14352.1 hypothetical protein BIV59_03615 [Bacillus sp. MUM 13]
MENIVFALLSLILLIPVIIFLPIGINWKGKAAVTVSALFISLVGLAATSVFPLWESLLISLLLFLCVIYMIGKRSESFLTAADDTDDKYYYAEEEPKSAITKMNDVFVIESEKPAFRDKGPEQDRAELPEELLAELEYAAAKDIDSAEGIEEKEIEEDSSFLEQRELLWDDLEVTEEVQEPETAVNLSEIEMMLEDGDSEGTISLEKAEPEEVQEPETDVDLSDIEMILQDGDSEGTISPEKAEPEEVQKPETDVYLSEIEMMLQDGNTVETISLEKAESVKGLSQEEYEFLLENPGESIEELEMPVWDDTQKDDREKEEEAETAANDWLELLESEEYVIVPMDEEKQEADINSGSELNSETLEIEVLLEETNTETSIEEMVQAQADTPLEDNQLPELEELNEPEEESQSSELVMESDFVQSADEVLNSFEESTEEHKKQLTNEIISEPAKEAELSHWEDSVKTEREEIVHIEEMADMNEEPEDDSIYIHGDEEEAVNSSITPSYIEVQKENVIATQLQQQMFQTLIDQIELARSTYSSSQFEELVKSHLNPDLPDLEYYTFASILVNHYIKKGDWDRLRHEIIELQSKFEKHSIIKEELKFLMDRYCKA